MAAITRYEKVNQFLNYVQFEKRYAAHTVTSYSNDLVQFFDYLATQYETDALEKVNSSMVRSWLASLKEQGLTSKSLNRKISALKSFYKYFMRQGLIKKSPMETVISPKVNKRLPQFVAEKDMIALLNGLEYHEGWKGYTEKLVIQVFYATGMRLSELINCKESQLDVSKKVIKVLGKGNKERVIPISAGLASDLTQYIKDKPEAFSATPTLFINEKGKPLTSKGVYTFVNFYLSQVTTLDKKSPHILRHSFATHLMNHGADLNAVKELLGHSSLAATQVYTHNTIEKLKEVFKKAHPKS